MSALCEFFNLAYSYPPFFSSKATLKTSSPAITVAVQTSSTADTEKGQTKSTLKSTISSAFFSCVDLLSL